MTHPYKEEPYPGAALDGGERIEDYVEPDAALDADLLLVTEYLSGRLTDKEAKEVERRFDEDAQFWDNVKEVVALLTMRAKYNLRYSGERPPPAPTPAPSLAQAPVPSAASPVAAPVAAPVVPPAGAPVRAPMPAPAPPVFQAPPAWMPPPLAPPAAHAWAAQQPDGLYPGETWWNRLTLRIFNPLVATVAFLAAVAGGWSWNELIQPGIRGVQHMLNPAHITAYDLAHGRASTVGFSNDSVVATDSIETRVIHLDSGSTGILRPTSRFTYRVRGDLVTQKHYGALDGEELLTVRQPWLVETHLAEVYLYPGTYAIRSDTLGNEMLLSVGAGHAVVRPIGGPNDSVIVHRGEYLRVPRMGLMLLSTTGEDFPPITEPRAGTPAAPTPPPSSSKPPLPHGE